MKKYFIFLIINIIVCILNPVFAMLKEDGNDTEVNLSRQASTTLNISCDNFSTSNTKIVLQQEACIIQGDDERYIAATLGLGTCVAFVVYNPDLCKGGLAHLDALQLSQLPAANNIIPLHTNIRSIISKCTDNIDASNCVCTIYSRLPKMVLEINAYIKKTRTMDKV